MSTDNIHDVAAPSLIKDAAALAARDPEFKANFERYFVDRLPFRRRLAVNVLVSVLGALTAKRPVPWQGPELVRELRARSTS